jgi:uncharacterized protein (TIGR02996 family)
MAVYFVFRCCYNAPGERQVRRFEFDTVLDWARSIWKPNPDERQAYRYAEELLGWTTVDAFGQLFIAIAEEGLRPPETMRDLVAGLSHVYIEEEDFGPHHLQLLVNIGDIQEAVYLFDDHFRARAPGLTDFLLLDGWELPDTWSDTAVPCLPGGCRVSPPGDGEGRVYTLSLLRNCRSHLEDLYGASHIEGARVPDLCRYALTHTNEKELEYELRSIRQALLEMLASPQGEDAGFLAAIRDEPGERVHWNAYSDWLADRGLPPAGLYLLEAALRAETFKGAQKTRDPTLDRVKVTPHMAQACKHEERETRTTPATPRDHYTQWIYFDDRWIAANPTVAAGLVGFASRWDVLSTTPRE